MCSTAVVRATVFSAPEKVGDEVKDLLVTIDFAVLKAVWWATVRCADVCMIVAAAPTRDIVARGSCRW